MSATQTTFDTDPQERAPNQGRSMSRIRSCTTPDSGTRRRAPSSALVAGREASKALAGTCAIPAEIAYTTYYV